VKIKAILRKKGKQSVKEWLKDLRTPLKSAWIFLPQARPGHHEKSLLLGQGETCNQEWLD